MKVNGSSENIGLLAVMFKFPALELESDPFSSEELSMSPIFKMPAVEVTCISIFLPFPALSPLVIELVRIEPVRISPSAW